VCDGSGRLCHLPDLQPALALRGVPSFRVFNEGRLQVRDGERSAAVGVYWEHAPELDSWLFTGPLGQGLARIESKAGGARMILSDGARSVPVRPPSLRRACWASVRPWRSFPAG
jgi:outer membrane biogenesis lipoprotein LolB